MAIFVTIIAIFFLSLSCKNNTKDVIDAVEDRAAIPKMRVTDITTVVSDSGITRARVSAPIWEVYDKASPPYWEFVEGIYLERFDTILSVEASIHSKYAHYNERDQIWTLKGEVKATNPEGDLFETELLFWNQNKEMGVYTDSLITITETTGRVIVGRDGFESNQSLTKYYIHDSNGDIPVEENEW